MTGGKCPGEAPGHKSLQISPWRRCHGFGQRGCRRLGVQLAVEVAGDDVIHGVLHRCRVGMAVRHRAEQLAVLVGLGEVGDRLLAAIVEGVVRHVGARRRRALDDVERRLELRALDGRGHLELGRLVGVADLEHHELVGVEGDGALGAGEADADEVRARLLAGLEEFALRPVAHELHAGLALDDHRGSEVPVAAGEVGVDILLELGHLVEHFDHLVAAECRGIEVDHRGLVEVGACGQHDGVEDRRVLPGLAAMADRRDAVRLHLVEDGDQLVPGLGRLAAGGVERLLVDPDPVGRVDVDRSRDPLAVILRERLERGRNDLVPAFLRRRLRRDRRRRPAWPSR